MKKILIANRGEIAIRVIRTARKMGIKTVAVYSEADRRSPHVFMADENYCIGPAPSSESYLRGDKIIEAAKKLNADAIHPGFGFLSENASFAQLVKDSGLIFIGPSPEAIEAMGDKLTAKRTVKALGIPLVPGVDHPVEEVAEALKIARTIEFPLMIKAAAGGGGKGMRIVESEAELEEQMQRAISEAKASFGNGAVFIEKYVTSPRHIEFQVLADEHGNVFHLFERECSIQRRHQKVIEEAPSAVLTPELRAKMGSDAVKIARSCNYTGAGTVEFLVDDRLNYYFLEMNTRLQVEHPVTEMITGLDLVEQQIRVARGEILPFKQEDFEIKGHSVQLRVYAEDPYNQFLPNTGRLEKYHLPDLPNIRLDSGYYEGQDIPIHYDPMISKLIAYGSTRHEALQNIINAIDHFEIEGVRTTLPFGKFVFQNEHFVNGNFDTHFVKLHFYEQAGELDKEEAQVAAHLALSSYLEHKAILKEPKSEAVNWYRKR